MTWPPLERYRFMRDHRWAGSRFSAYLDGELAAGEGARLEDHVHRCARCQRMLEALRETLAGLRRLTSATRPPDDLADAVIERLREEGGR